MGRMLLPPFLLVADDLVQVQLMTSLIRRIGLANELLVSASVAEARAYLQGCATSRLPVIVLTRGTADDASGTGLIEWIRIQDDAIAALDVIALFANDDVAAGDRARELGATVVSEPVEMKVLIAAMKALALPEKARIDPATLMVRVELWPRPGGVSRQ